MLEGGGQLTGHLDTSGHFSGPDLTFLYPDLLTALTGTFVRGRMVAAVTARVRTVVLIILHYIWLLQTKLLTV